MLNQFELTYSNFYKKITPLVKNHIHQMVYTTTADALTRMGDYPIPFTERFVEKTSSQQTGKIVAYLRNSGQPVRLDTYVKFVALLHVRRLHQIATAAQMLRPSRKTFQVPYNEYAIKNWEEDAVYEALLGTDGLERLSQAFSNAVDDLPLTQAAASGSYWSDGGDINDIAKHYSLLPAGMEQGIAQIHTSMMEQANPGRIETLLATNPSPEQYQVNFTSLFRSLYELELNSLSSKLAQRVRIILRRPAIRILIGAGGLGTLILNRRRRNALGYALNAIGGGMMVLAIASLLARKKQERSALRIRVKKTISLKIPIEKVYQLWENPENYSKFLSGVVDVSERGMGIHHWVMEGPLKSPIEFDTITTEKSENKTIAWEAVSPLTFQQSGEVRFKEARNGQTEITVQLSYAPPMGVGEMVVYHLLIRDPIQFLEADLVRMTSVLEQQKMPETAYLRRSLHD